MRKNTCSPLLQRAEVHGSQPSMAGPTLDDITDSVCAEGTFHKCLPTGMCYNFQSYCSDRSRTVNSCFPYDIVADNKGLLDWCQKQISNNFTSLIHPSCKYACIDQFNASALYQCLPCNDGNSSDCTWVYPVVWVLSTLLLVSIVVIIMLSILLCKSWRGRHPTEVNDEESGDRNNMPKDNNKNGENSEGQATPPMEEARETDINVNRPALKDRNLPSGIHLGPVQGRSLDTHNGAPINQDEHDQGRSPNTQKVVPRNQSGPVQGRNTQNGAPRNEHEQDHDRNRNTKNGAPRNQHEQDHDRNRNTKNGAPRNQHEQDHDRNRNTQNGTPRGQYEHDQDINTQNETPDIQHDDIQGRNTNIQYGALMDDRNSGSCRNTQSGFLISQHEPQQGRNTRNLSPIRQLDHDHSTRNTQDDQARCYLEPRASVTSPSSVSFRRDFGGTAEERSALIPNNSPGSDDSLSRRQAPREMSANFSPQIPEAEGRHEVVTNLSMLKRE